MKLWNWKRKPNGENGAPRPTPTPETTLTVTLKDGKVSIVGPLSNKILCYGMLEAARDAVRDYRAASPLIQPATLMPTVTIQDR